MTNILAAIEQSASNNGKPVCVEGMFSFACDARDLVDNGLAVVSAGEAGCAVLTGNDPEDRPFMVILSDLYVHEVTE